VIVSLLIGAMMGWSFGAIIDTSIPPWAFLIVGGGLAVLAGWAAHKAAITAVMIGVCGLAGAAVPLGAVQLGVVNAAAAEADQSVAAESLTADAETEDETRGLSDDLAVFVRLAVGKQTQAPGEAESAGTDATLQPSEFVDVPAVDQTTRQQVYELRHQMKAMFTAAMQRWSDLPGEARRVTIIGLTIGVLVGLGMGLIAPGFSILVATSILGAVLLLMGGWGLLDRMDSELVTAALPRSAQVWAVLWLITSIFGAVIQWTSKPKPVDRPA
jgi:hypothetical protein